MDKNLITRWFANRHLFAFNGVDSRTPLDYVHPYHRADLQKIIDSAPPSIDMIIVYGSSIGDYLHDDSDLDLAIISKDRQCLSRDFLYGLGLSTTVDAHIFDSLQELIDQAQGLFPTPRAIIDQGLPVYVKQKEVIML